jgi:hypothetical protein
MNSQTQRRIVFRAPLPPGLRLPRAGAPLHSPFSILHSPIFISETGSSSLRVRISDSTRDRHLGRTGPRPGARAGPSHLRAAEEAGSPRPKSPVHRPRRVLGFQSGSVSADRQSDSDAVGESVPVFELGVGEWLESAGLPMDRYQVPTFRKRVLNV